MIDYRTDGKVAIITIDRPDARNAVNGEVAEGIEAALDRLEADDELWVGILTHTGPVFSAGADLKALQRGEGGRLYTKRGGFAGVASRERTKPLIAACDGPALAGGCEITLACDLIVAAADASFGVPEVKRNLIAAAGAIFRLPKVLPRNVAMEMLMTGAPISAARAHELGMVNRLVPVGGALEAAVALAEEICANAPLAVRASRRVLLETEGADDATGFRVSNEVIATVMASEDTAEGLAAFVEKRVPEWKGR